MTDALDLWKQPRAKEINMLAGWRTGGCWLGFFRPA